VHGATTRPKYIGMRMPPNPHCSEMPPRLTLAKLIGARTACPPWQICADNLSALLDVPDDA
jgi:hypothetical protein